MIELGVRDSLPARGLDLVDDLLSDRLVGSLAAKAGAEVVDDHRGAFGSQLHGDCPPDAATGAGNERSLSIKLPHGASH